MKNIFLLLGLLLLSSCSNSFLEIYPETSLNEGNFYKSEKEYILLANGCYIPMRNYYKESGWIIGEIRSDNTSFMYNPNDGGQIDARQIEWFQCTANNTHYTSLWNFAYNGINRCNKLIEELENSSIIWETEGIKERCYGEAYFFRAFYYFELVRNFGGVPLITSVINSQEAVSVERVSEMEIYNQVIKDLEASVLNFETSVNVEEPGRANYASALSLLGRVYLTMHEYDKTISVLEKVISLKKYTLLPEYKDLFNPAAKDFKETIFAVQYSENNQDMANQFCFRFAPWTSKGEITMRPNINISGSRYGWNQPTSDLILAFEEGDKRKEASIGTWHGKDWDGVERDLMYCCKFKPPVSAPDDRCSDNLPIIRYSDVLLMMAEALNEKGETSRALSFVEKVRNRAGLSTPTNITKESLSILIAKERQVEFCFENQRWYDLKRTGKALDVMRTHGIKEKQMKPYIDQSTYILEEYMLLAPIPADEIAISALKQNPGY